MRRKQGGFSLSEAYKKIVARIGGWWDVDVRGYERIDDQFVETDSERVRREGGREENRKGQGAEAVREEKEGGRLEMIAVILRFQLRTKSVCDDGIKGSCMAVVCRRLGLSSLVPDNAHYLTRHTGSKFVGFSVYTLV